MKSRILVTLIVLLAPPILTWATSPAQNQTNFPQDGYSDSMSSDDHTSQVDQTNREPSSSNSESKEFKDKPSNQPWSHQRRDDTRWMDRF